MADTDTAHRTADTDTADTAKLVPIQLTEKEDEICTLLLQVASTIPEQPTLRIAGGWVRDKLLGLASHDIDIAVDRMSGFELATRVNEYLAAHAYETSTLAKISSNPERSKHLETATLRVLGHSVDFVHLRSEQYDADSRIPRVAFGTPGEDARRRDITINALFYNLHTRAVEDFTGCGLRDLREGRVRTPMDARQTFADDPLRVLRVLRFASRFGYAIAGSTGAAMQCAVVARDLDAKISRERVGVELEKMASGERPLLAVQLVLRYGLYASVFQAPPQASWTRSADNRAGGTGNADSSSPTDMDTAIDPGVAESVTSSVLRVLDTEELTARVPAQLKVAARERRALVLAAYVYPFDGFVVADRRRRVPVALAVVRDGLKLPVADADTVAAIHALAPRVSEMAARCQRGPVARNELGSMVRDAGMRWPMAVLFAAAIELHARADVAGVVSTYAALFDAINGAGLADAFTLKHIVNGRDAAALLGCRTGPLIKPVLDRVMDWQLAHPDATNEQARQFILDEIAPNMPL
ncbi:CCA tRNA nucleotidyltransferase, mitochondrial [Coemansia erecta]|nr:CCA tRNA nucleotidyltransferase, mitochondrial [Coemansia sp. RSA 2618]KAJ2820621.1 CCA tRNA nucleotidyltransferase, mitochondrial [Coemansia erecta]